jgi:two-component system, OmpR family, phosphate regulon sensor histidine kinase PhoR
VAIAALAPRVSVGTARPWHSRVLRFPHANVQLRRAQLVLMLAVLAPTVAMIAVGIVLLALADDASALVAGILILTLCTTGVTGYILGSIFVGKGASLVRVQNDFLSSVSHELRTPLTSMSLFMESLRDGRLDPEDQRKVVELMSGEIGRLDGLVGRLLELSRLESGRHAFERLRVDMEPLVAEAIATFEASTLARPTAISVDLEKDLWVIGDRATLIRAISNLLVNAWKYTNDDKRISLAVRSHGRWIDIAVRDNGIGMPRGEQREVFEEFARGKEAIDRGLPGVGLGLAFVRAIVRAHRGKIVISSRPGGGSEFRIRLRRPRGETVPTTTRSGRSSAGPAAPARS